MLLLLHLNPRLQSLQGSLAELLIDLIAYTKIFNCSNYYHYKMFTVGDKMFEILYYKI